MALTQIGKYQIIKQLGQGGFGAVYLAEDPALKTKVAIKVFSISDPQLAQQATSATSEAGKILRDRFLSEARILRQLASNPHIVDIYEFDELEDGTPYYVMPFLTHSLSDDIGKDVFTTQALKDLAPEQRPRKLPVNQATRILEQVLSGLKAVHAAELIHRDIKPANILFDEHGNAQLCDFGIAKAPDTQHSQTGVAMGSRNYMSPEQRESAKYVTARSDVYSVATMAYRMLTGSLPIDLSQRPIDFSPAVGEALDQLIMAGLSHDPDKRPADAGEFLQQLQQAIRHIDKSAPEVSEHTGTEMGEAPQAISSELKPLQDKIQNFLLESITLTDEQREQLSLAADVLGVDQTKLDQLIAAIEQQLQPKLQPLKNFLKAVDKQLDRGNGTLSDDQKNLLLQVAEETGQKRATLESLLANQVAAYEIKAPQGDAGKSAQQANNNIAEPSSVEGKPDEGKSKSKAPLFATAAFLLLGGAGGYWYTQNNQLPEQSFQGASVADIDEIVRAEVAEVTGRPLPQPQQHKPSIESYQLWVETIPKGAKVILPDIGPAYSPGMQLDAGKYRIQVKASGYKTKTQWADLSASNQKLSVVLEKAAQEKNPTVGSGGKRTYTKKELMAKGEKEYLSRCSACHQVNGRGLPPTFPAIAGSSVAMGAVVDHIAIVADGKNAMPPFKRLLDPETMAAIITYQRNAWGNVPSDGVDVVQPHMIDPLPELTGEAGYQAACVACHGAGVMGAPVPGNRHQWSSRIAKGMDVLYENAINGLKLMPPKGGCGSCSDEDIKSIVDYMVRKSQ